MSDRAVGKRLLTVVVSILLCVHVVGALSFSSRAHAQVEPDEGFDDDDVFDEPGGPQRDNSKNGNLPNNNGQQFRRNGDQPPANQGQPPMSNRPDSGPSRNTLGPTTEGPVQFHLVDPPKFWKKKKRHRPSKKSDEKKPAKKILPPMTTPPVPTADAQSNGQSNSSTGAVTGPGP